MSSAQFSGCDRGGSQAITGDFNGDGTRDWSGLLRNSRGDVDLLVVYSAAGEYAHDLLTPLGKDAEVLNVDVILEPPGELVGFPVDGSNCPPRLTIENPGVHLFYFEKASVLYYWSADHFGEFVTSD